MNESQGTGAFMSSPCSDLTRCRTTLNIIWSCLATIFGCTWVSIHPSIPRADDTPYKIARRRAGLMAFALIAPELVILGAMWQRFSADDMAARYQGFGWTRTHGFFAYMGGFMLWDGDQPVGILLPEQLEPYLVRGEIDITEKEIRDKSKCDALAKGLVIIQTGWFALQCVARGIQNLPITEIELATLAFAALNFGTYWLWWEKPMDVRCPIAVRRKRTPQRSNTMDEVSSKPTDTFPTVQRADATARKPSMESWADAVLYPLKALISTMSLTWGGGGYMKPGSMIKRIPTFYPAPIRLEVVGWLHFTAAVAGIIFGAIHCIGWSSSFQFASDPERILWRTASTVIICVPFCFLLLSIAFWTCTGRTRRPETLPPYMSLFFAMSVLVGGVSYACSRIVLLSLAVASLRSLPPGAFQAVHWITLIPHI